MLEGAHHMWTFFLKIPNNTCINITQRSEVIKGGLFNLQPQRVIANNYDDTTILEEWKKNEEEKERKDKERRSMLQKASEAHLVVGALITTVTFAACITMPGGFVGSEEGSSHPGSALLRKNIVFSAFIFTNTISMVLSSSAVFIHLLMPFLFNERYYDKELQTYSREEHRDKLLYMAFRLILWAMIAMVLAFVTGTYVVLVPSLGLAIPNCIIGLTFLAILLFVFRKGIDLSFREILHLLTGKF
jgi:small-conductance mechanosensitive channel